MLNQIKNKIFPTIGAIGIAIAPMATLVSCSDESSSNDDVANESHILLSSNQDILNNTRANSSDEIKAIDVAKITKDMDTQKLMDEVHKLKSNKEKLRLTIKFNDAEIEVDAQVKHTNHVVVTINKMYLHNQSIEKKELKSNGNTAKFKKHVKSLLVSLVKTATNNELTKEQIKDEILKLYSSDLGMEFMFFPANYHNMAPWQGTWVENVDYNRASFVFNKGSDAIEMLNNAITPNILQNYTALDTIETALRNFAVTLKTDTDFGSWATAEGVLQTQTNPQSGITFGAFTSKSGNNDDMIALSINNLSKNLVYTFLKRADSSMMGLNGDSLKLWNVLMDLIKV